MSTVFQTLINHLHEATSTDALREAMSGFADSYGAAGSLVILLVWVYYSAQVFFLGAEFPRAYACRFGSMFAATLEAGSYVSS